MSTTSCERCEDFAADARKVLSKRCAPDERHCSCVPHLRAEIERLNVELEEARLTLAAERGRADGAPSDGWVYTAGFYERWEKGKAVVQNLYPLGWKWRVGRRKFRDAPTARAAMLAADATK